MGVYIRELGVPDVRKPPRCRDHALAGWDTVSNPPAARVPQGPSENGGRKDDATSKTPSGARQDMIRSCTRQKRILITSQLKTGFRGHFAFAGPAAPLPEGTPLWAF